VNRDLAPAVALADRWPAPLGPPHDPNGRIQPVPSGCRDACSACGDLVHGPRGVTADGGPLVDGRRRGLRVEHRRRGAEAPGKKRNGAAHRGGRALVRWRGEAAVAAF
jgi:hypothetical protein